MPLEPSRLQPLSALGPASAPAAAPIDVLLVDDHRCVLWGLERLIDGERPRMQVAGKASTTTEAQAMAADIAPDIVVLDLDLNGERGETIVPALAAVPGVQVLVLTGSRDPDAHRTAMMRGARGVVMKDAPAETLIRAIERVHAGEVWLDRVSIGGLLAAMTAPPPPPDATGRRIESLTARERQIIRALVRHRDANGRDVAAALFISEHTLRNHLTTIFGKLALRNRLALVLFALEHKLAD